MPLNGRRDDGNASRLANNPEVQARLAELQTQIGGENNVTVASLLDELEAARAKSTNFDQLSAAVRAIEAKAKISGLLIQRIAQSLSNWPGMNNPLQRGEIACLNGNASA